MRCTLCTYLLSLFTYTQLNPGQEEEEEMEALPTALYRRCANIKSRKNPDVQCPLSASHGDYCFRHHKNPRPYRPRSLSQEEPTTPTHVAAVRKIQRAWRLLSPLLRFTHQGPAANDRSLSSNSTELYSLDPVAEIPATYLFSFADARKAIWIFDIRTLSHSLGAGHPQENPYTREQLTDAAMSALHKRIAWLRSRKYQIQHVNTDVLTPEQLWNQKVLDVFLKIEALGYYASCDWFHEMSAYSHEYFYRRLFDLWNYRLGLTPTQKEAVVPGHLRGGGQRLFRTPPEDLAPKERVWWQRTNLDLIDAFVSRAAEKDSRKLGAMYVLMGLVQVSREAARALPWVTAVI